MGNNDTQPLTWDIVNLGESEPQESIPLRELDAHFPLYRKPEREFNFFKVFLVEQVPEAVFRVNEGVCDRRPNFEPQYGQHFILQNDELRLVGKCVDHPFKIYTYGLLFAILHHKKVTASKGSSQKFTHRGQTKELHMGGRGFGPDSLCDRQ